MTLKAMWDMLKEAWQAWSKDKATRLGAALAYYTDNSKLVDVP